MKSWWRWRTARWTWLLVGETGTGKEVFARKLHELSGRFGPLVSVNCAALPEAVAEGELFGYRKGAFTSAICSSVGYLRSAHQGTLFLDEVVELDERQQRLHMSVCRHASAI